MDSLRRDVRYALRAFARRPLVAAGAIASLSIGIAANTAVFGIADAVLFKDVPGITRTERLVEISRDVAGTTSDVTFPMYRYLRAQTAVLDDLAALALESISFAATSEPTVRGGLVVTANYFPMLGVQAARGRLFAPAEAQYPTVEPVVVITHDVWQREFGGAEDIVGRVARVNGTPVRVVGVLPRGFAGHHTGLLVDVYLPLGLAIPGLPDPTTFTRGNGSSLELLGRLHEGVTASQATRALGASADAFARENGEATSGHPYAVRVDKWGPLPATVRAPVAAFLSVLFVLVALALAMACTNVTTILLAQASERQRELAVRRAMGASEGRLVRQIVTEIAVLFAIGGAVGVGAAAWATGLIGGVEPPVPIPGRLGADFGFDASVLIFSLIVTLGSALLFSLPAALHAARFDLFPALREGGASDTKGRARVRSTLVGAQVAGTCVLLAATLMFGRALHATRDLDPGWNADGVFVAPIDLQLNGTPKAAGVAVQRDIIEGLSAVPDIEVAALATKLPGGGRSSFGLVSVPGIEPPQGLPGFDASLNRVSAGYLRAMRIPLLRGRDIASTDDERAPRVAVINETMAHRIWGAHDPIGRSFFIRQPEQRLEFRVVGVAGDVRFSPRGQALEMFYYVPAAQWYNAQVMLHIRARPGHESAAAAAVRRVVRGVDPSVTLTSVRPLTEALAVYLIPQRLAAWVSGAMGVFGLLLAVVGIYGLTAFLVSRRAREIAIRMALGATNRDVIRLLVRQGGRAPAVGLAIGMVLSGALSVAASSVVAGAKAGDPIVVFGMPTVIAITVAVALLAPMHRVLRASTMTALRAD
jgi:putative ABC transport system permease protein